jgi:two-component system, NarL family, nitrate/nitrite response regulator NarL
MTNTQAAWELASSSNAPYKIMIIDDHDWIINGLISSLEMNEEYKVIATAQYADEARQRMSREVNLVIMDIRLPPSCGKEAQRCGIDLAAEFHEKYPDSAILILSGETKVGLVHRAWAAGVCGYVLKIHTSHLEDAINAVRRNGRYSDPDLPKIISTLPKLDLLTKREKEVLRALPRLSLNAGKRVGSELNIKPVTVNTHCKNMRNKLNVSQEKLLQIAEDYFGEDR